MDSIISRQGAPLGTGRIYPAGSLRDAELATLLASYKNNVAGAYTSVSPDAIATTIPAGQHMASTKIDGEQWFLCRSETGSYLASPGGKIITGVPITEEADRLLADWNGVIAGELYTTVDTGRPSVFSLHSALGGGIDAQIERLRFAAFDILRDGDGDCQLLPFTERARRIQEMLTGSELLHPADFVEIDGPLEAQRFFESRVQSGAEGIVIRCSDGRIFKLKPKIMIDAAVVAYTETSAGVGELLLALVPHEHPGEMQTMQIIGRVDIGFRANERRELADRLSPLKCGSAINLSSRSSHPYIWVCPQIVVEVSCHELLSTSSDGEPIRRWRVTHDNDGWKSTGKAASISMRDAVFIRVRVDKVAKLPDVRWSQVADIVDVPAPSTNITDLPKSEVIRREVYTKPIRNYGVAVRKFAVWKTNKEDTDPRYPAYAAMFTDYSPSRQEPMRSELRVACSVERIMVVVDNWLAVNVKRGWQCVATMSCVAARNVTTNAALTSEDSIPPLHTTPSSHSLSIAFARSTSPTFAVVRRRLDALSELGELNITKDDAGKEVWFELHVRAGLVEHYRRITNLLTLVKRWKSIEVVLDGEVLDRHTLDDVLNRIDEIQQCWSRRKATGPAGCRRDCTLGCRSLRITASHRFLEGAFITEPQWYTVGKFESGKVIVDKAGLVAQLDWRRNKLVDCCPCFDKESVLSAVESLPEVLSADVPGYQLVYKRDDGLSAWVWPEHASMPSRLDTHGVQMRSPQTGEPYLGMSLASSSTRPSPSRTIPVASYADVCGQEEAVQIVRDLIELPMRHAHMFEAVGVTAKPRGVILAGPPGTGKTLLARAVAGQCGAHLEIVSGPELLSPYVGATEQALREVFERASRNTPSLILFDELDSIAPSRATADAHHQQTLVAQLLTLLDGIEGRSGISVLATTNRPKSIDAALRRPGRFDQVVMMRLPNVHGRSAILRHYLKPLKLDSSIDVDLLIGDLATLMDGASGADLEYLCQSAARACVKEAVAAGQSDEETMIAERHLRVATLEYTSSHGV
ncbi:MAG: AAA family ATPase [Armatimonadota bacterium]